MPTNIELQALRKLDAMSDEDIDTSDIPEQTDWTGSVRGKFYDPNPRRASRKQDGKVPSPLMGEG